MMGIWMRWMDAGIAKDSAPLLVSYVFGESASHASPDIN